MTSRHCGTSLKVPSPSLRRTCHRVGPIVGMHNGVVQAFHEFLRLEMCFSGRTRNLNVESTGNHAAVLAGTEPEGDSDSDSESDRY